MNNKPSNPTNLAREIAEILKSDAVAAGQIREFVKADELVNLLGLREEIAQDEDGTEEEFWANIVKEYSLEEVLTAYRLPASLG